MFIYQRQLYLENCDYLCVRAMYSVPLVAFHQWLVPFHVRNLKICFCAPNITKLSKQLWIKMFTATCPLYRTSWRVRKLQLPLWLSIRQSGRLFQEKGSSHLICMILKSDNYMTCWHTNGTCCRNHKVFSTLKRFHRVVISNFELIIAIFQTISLSVELAKVWQCYA